MPAKCPYCETNTHPDNSTTCDRVFLTPDEALNIIQYDKDADGVHVFMNPSASVLVGADWSFESIKELFVSAYWIEICEPTGMARSMKHGIAVADHKKGTQWFIATNEDALQAYEQSHCKD